MEKFKPSMIVEITRDHPDEAFVALGLLLLVVAGVAGVIAGNVFAAVAVFFPAFFGAGALMDVAERRRCRTLDRG